MTVKIADFGLSQQLALVKASDAGGMLTEVCGTPDYFAPELAQMAAAAASRPSDQENLPLGAQSAHICPQSAHICPQSAHISPQSPHISPHLPTRPSLTFVAHGHLAAGEDLSDASTGYGPPLDCWAVGCIVYELLAGHPPYRAQVGAAAHSHGLP